MKGNTNLGPTLTYALAAIAIASVSSAFASLANAAERYGRDSVYVEAGKSYGSAPAQPQSQPFGRDSVYVTKDTVLSPPNSVKAGDVATKRFGRDSVYATTVLSGAKQETSQPSSNTPERGVR